MDKRKSALLSAIIKEYIKTAEPIGSNLLVDKYRFKLSPATIRNEMAELEEEGYLIQPHISSGRIPSEKAFHFYLKNISKKEITLQDKKLLEEKLKNEENEERILKELAKTLAYLADGAVILGFSPQDVYYTGMYYFLRKPEFINHKVIWQFGDLIDRLSDIVYEIFPKIQETKILIGRDNPFGRDCGSIFTQYQLKRRNKGLLAVLGPIRMDYQNNLGLIKYTKELISRI